MQVNNTCEAEGRAVNILGTASPADATYGANGVFRVQFPGQPAPDCPGPNYIVQGECNHHIPSKHHANKPKDLADDIAIVQSNNFTTLFILSREQHLEDTVLDVSVFTCHLLDSTNSATGLD